MVLFLRGNSSICPKPLTELSPLEADRGALLMARVSLSNCAHALTKVARVNRSFYWLQE
jgi:hypothetical protein